MGAYKNHEFLDLLQKEQERDRMELARREQQYLLSRRSAFDWKSMFAYADGRLIWRARPIGQFASIHAAKRWNGRYAGTICGSKAENHRNGSCRVKVNRELYLVSRIVWEMHNGPIPDGFVIDHMNGDPKDNRIENLRKCSFRENTYNRKTHTSNTSGIKGVSYYKRNKAWGATISADGKPTFLGLHPTKGLAGVAYAKASIRLHGQYSHINSRKAQPAKATTQKPPKGK